MLLESYSTKKIFFLILSFHRTPYTSYSSIVSRRIRIPHTHIGLKEPRAVCVFFDFDFEDFRRVKRSRAMFKCGGMYFHTIQTNYAHISCTYVVF